MTLCTRTKKTTSEANEKGISLMKKTRRIIIKYIINQFDMNLNAKALGLSVGIIWALGLVIITLLSMYAGIWGEGVSFLSQFYIGYEESLQGILIGIVYAFLDGFIGSWLVATLYNKLA